MVIKCSDEKAAKLIASMLKRYWEVIVKEDYPLTPFEMRELDVLESAILLIRARNERA